MLRRSRVDRALKVISISGSGHSGATLLAVLMTQGRGAFNLGPLRHIWSGISDGLPCSCGAGLRDCPIHGAAVAAARRASGGIAVDAIHTLSTEFLRAADLSADWGDPDARATLRTAHSGFLSALSATLQQVKATTGTHTFVDTSGMPAMALAFDLLEGADLRVLNLVRDPRAVACSRYGQTLSLGATLAQLRIWRRRQHRLEHWRHGLGARFTALRHEDFTARPRDALAATLQWAGLQPAAGLFANSETVQLTWAEQHIYPPADETLLAERPERMSIRTDEAWRSRRNVILHALAMATTWPAMRRHYPRGAGANVFARD